MYHEQAIIKSVLCHRNSPDGEWIPYTDEELTGMLQNYHNIRFHIMRLLDDAANYDYLRSKAQNLNAMIYNFPY